VLVFLPADRRLTDEKYHLSRHFIYGAGNQKQVWAAAGFTMSHLTPQRSSRGETSSQALEGFEARF
jgi:hypothetical protein